MEMRRVEKVVVCAAVMSLAFGANAMGASMDESRAFFDFNDGLPFNQQLNPAGGEVFETVGTGGQTVNVAAGSTPPFSYTASGAIGAMTPDGWGYGFWGGYIDFGTGAGDELDLAGSPGISVVWRMNGQDPSGRWSSGQGLVSAMSSPAPNGWSDRQYLLGVQASGQNGVSVNFLVKGPGWTQHVIDMATDFNMMQWATYSYVYDGATGDVTFSAWGDDGDTYSYVNATGVIGTIGAVAGHPTVQVGVGRNSDGSVNTSQLLRNTIIDGIAIFDKALTPTEVETMVLPEPASMAMCLLGGGFVMLRRRRS